MDESLPAPPAIVHPAYGGFWRRVCAELLDELIVVVIFFAVAIMILIPTLILVEVAGRELDADKYGNIVGPLMAISLFCIYRAGFEASSKQATPGKLAMGLKVTDEHGKRLSFGRASVRSVAKIVSHLLFNSGFIMVGLTLRKQGLHDMVAKTLVVRTR